MPDFKPPPGRNLGLDLLRATAIVMVLFNHWIAHFGGWFSFHVPALADTIGDTGVEIFFALSGFLIGRILIDMTRTRPEWADFRVFMTRRAVRTLPLYFLWLCFLLAVFPPLVTALVTALRYLTLTQNLVAEMPPDYFFAVTWSLTIEEWFYLLFGTALVVLSRRMSGSAALGCCLVIFLTVPATLRLYYHMRGALVYMRIDEIAYGVLMARLYQNDSLLFRHPWAALAAGLGCLAAAFWDVLPASVAVPLTSNLEVIGGALCLPAALRLTHLPAVLERPVRWLASRSYALYLIHLTILVDLGERLWVDRGVMSPWAAAIICIVIPFPLAELSYRFVETPLLRLRPQQSSPPAPLPMTVVAR